ncbi:MAG: S46 family peptidase [Acidobacteria bacterium]|nr:S46 family peptidase [Acidobacteriota bacterium]
MALLRSFPIVLWGLVAVHAEEGMWTYNNFPSQKLNALHGFAPSEQWLEKARLASVRLAQGCSASFVSPNGLILTNHHCATACIQDLSTPEKDYLAKGFWARQEGEELRCPNVEANQLAEITDVTAAITKVTSGKKDQEANEARKAEIARLEKAAATSENVRCDVVTLYGGGHYELYKYRRYQDVRLVFAPELGIALFGGDPDNFMFPRYNLDLSFLRAYDNGRPAASPNFFAVSKSGPKEGDLTFVSGHPGGTYRQLTIAQLELERDFVKPHLLYSFSELRGNLVQFQQRGAEQKRVSQSYLLSVENTIKAFKGEQAALTSKDFFKQLQAKEVDFRKRVMADRKLAFGMGGLWDEMEAVVKRERALFLRYIYLAAGFRTSLFAHARQLVRLADELAKPNEKRLEEYTESRLPQLRQYLLSTAPVSKELEIEKMTFALTKLVEALGPDDPDVRRILGKQSPREIATSMVNGTQLDQPQVCKRLLEGGKAALDQSTDPMIGLARKIDPAARAVRKQHEDEVESPIKRLGEKLAQARFAVYGASIYPDATFTLRLSVGQVKGWMESGRMVHPFTIFGGAFERHTGSDPFALPGSWLDAKEKLNPQTHFNFVTTNDIIGGNSGSPVFNKDLQLVGLIFDGNIHSLGGNYGFDPEVNRAVAVDSAGIMEALEKVYGAGRVVNELFRPPPAP